MVYRKGPVVHHRFSDAVRTVPGNGPMHAGWKLMAADR